MWIILQEHYSRITSREELMDMFDEIFPPPRLCLCWGIISRTSSGLMVSPSIKRGWLSKSCFSNFLIMCFRRMCYCNIFTKAFTLSSKVLPANSFRIESKHTNFTYCRCFLIKWPKSIMHPIQGKIKSLI